MEKEFIRSSHVGAVFTNGELVDENFESIGNTLWKIVGFDEILQKSMKDAKSFNILLNHNIVTGATLAFRKEYTKLLLPIPSVWVHDAWIALLIACASKLTFIPKNLIKYRVHQNQQIGVEKKRFPKLFKHATNLTRQTYIDEARCLGLVFKRMSTHDSMKNKYLELIEMKIAHLKMRSNLPKQKIMRILPILNECLRLKYHKYSFGMKSIIVDLFLRTT